MLKINHIFYLALILITFSFNNLYFVKADCEKSLSNKEDVPEGNKEGSLSESSKTDKDELIKTERNKFLEVLIEKRKERLLRKEIK